MFMSKVVSRRQAGRGRGRGRGRVQPRRFERHSVRCPVRVRIGNRQYAAYLDNASEGGVKVSTGSRIVPAEQGDPADPRPAADQGRAALVERARGGCRLSADRRAGADRAVAEAAVRGGGLARRGLGFGADDPSAAAEGRIPLRRWGERIRPPPCGLRPSARALRPVQGRAGQPTPIRLRTACPRRSGSSRSATDR